MVGPAVTIRVAFRSGDDRFVPGAAKMLVAPNLKRWWRGPAQEDLIRGVDQSEGSEWQ